MRAFLYATLIVSGVSLGAQENAVLLEVSYSYSPYAYSKTGWGVGAKYERVLTDGLSLGLGVGGMTFSRYGGDYFKLDLRPECRFYLDAHAPSGLFVGAGAGYTLAGIGDMRVHFPVASASLGYKLVFGWFALDLGLNFSVLFALSDLFHPETSLKAKILLGFVF